MIPNRTIIAARLVAEHYGLEVSKMFGRSQERKYSHARWVAFWLCSEVGGMASTVIGRKFDRDHSTVLHGIKQAKKRMARLPVVATDCNALAALFREECGVEAEPFAVLRTCPTQVSFSMTYPLAVDHGVSRETVAA